VLAYFILQVLLQDYDFLGVYIFATSAAIFISTPLWLILSKSRGKVFCYMLASAIFAMNALSWFWAGAGDPIWHFYLRGLFAGLGSGGMLLMGQAMLPDTIAYDAQLSGTKREGVFAGIYTSAEKLAFAFGAAVSGIFLGTMGYVESTSGMVEQPESALLAIRLSISILPMILVFISCLFLIPYDLDEEKLAALKPSS
jgi:GPH family glycoside/pentoside/hexuronide:cation symporter